MSGVNLLATDGLPERNIRKGSLEAIKKYILMKQM